MFQRAAILVTTLLVAAAPALAHAVPKTMTPAPDSTISAPTEISMVFSEELEPKFSVIRLLDSSGAVVSKAASVLDPADSKHMTLALPKLTPGIYTVQWTSSATDGHRLSRSYTFTVK